MTIHLPADTAMALALAFSHADYSVAARRKLAADAIEDLIAFLDDTDGDCDLEENGDEHDSSWPAVGPHAFGMALDEGDEEDDPKEAHGDDEPSLGSVLGTGVYVEAMGFWRVKPHYLTEEEFAQSERLRQDVRPVHGAMGQASWSAGAGGDIEDEHDGSEADVGDFEHSLGRPDHVIDQSLPCGFGQDEAEEVNEDGGDILDEPHDDNELDGPEWGGEPEWPVHGNQMTDEEKAAVASEGRRLLKRARAMESGPCVG
ncbi:hypothetical protein [Devosia sediminis]|uniref:Uncharacterized protein n=1 Tax=Devosia sediminis TaxID=2798801 RepID=A0A934IW04_9HYPH|nr:hypothetical protein [Devosia sediminis]MBJ3784030.1 hypothetical protein [Devosia sediminis]